MTPKGSRKRVKPSPSGADSPSPAAPGNAARDRSDSQRSGRASWYPGSWSTTSRTSKADPITEVARESISVAQNVASGIAESTTSLLDTPKTSRNPSIQLTKRASISTRSLPADVTTTRVNIASDGSASAAALDKIDTPTPARIRKPNNEEERATNSVEKSSQEQAQTIVTESDTPTPHISQSTSTEQPVGWFSWMYRSAPAVKGATNDHETVGITQKQPGEDQPSTQTSQEAVAPDANEPVKQPQQGQGQDQLHTTAEAQPTSQKRSWLQMWYGSSSSTKPAEQPTQETAQETPEDSGYTASQDVNMTPKNSPEDPPEETGPSQSSVGNAKSSGWSFWSKEPARGTAPSKPQEVEAVEATLEPNTLARPTSLEPDTEANVNVTKRGSVKVKLPKDGRMKEGVIPTVETNSTTTTAPAEPQPAGASASRQLQKILPNQVLPRFEETYNLEESPSFLQSLGRILHYTKGPEHNHVSRVKEPHRIKRALAIGVHGYFPAPVIRSVLGQPTGTSIRFSNMAAEAITKWTADHGYSCEVEKIALEGEGRIAERVDLLWKLLLNWMEEIRKADFILVACHSQGVPVSIMLVAKLIAFGCLDASRVGICAMAGVNMGPFSSYRSRWISGSAGELFEFELPSSKVSKDYEASLQCALDFGVRISYIGSIDDQLVSLESSLFSPIAHPYIYRSVFVDGRVHAPSFLSHLVGFALKLRNLGIPDHGLIRELSGPLAGSLYTGDGHSRLYDDEDVYYMAIQFALETSNVPDATLSIKRSNPLAYTNPYILPFAMRGLLEEEHVRRQMHDETMELLRQFDDWKPSSKVLKDVKFRLEGIRSKL
ncbi:hypothetical protein N7532_005476 [Penicillium argentinense]|uniref:YMC020W-like alpha/beta hydrolase domain-containing protein n=1 Tax=Penicillium argentinense TaxID=1131581 RepID=A0A9W9KA00_9EURO|nr:uncharacterized protein N7532_005476 [Penicillium argentinense]KAJ5098475.1 hypothetical protein N7532_005476 [Penicillium argentinense]